MTITLHAISAIDQNCMPLGWSAVAFQRDGETLSYMEIGQFREHAAAQDRLGAVFRYIDDWEMITGIRSTVEEIVVFFARREALPDQWQVLAPDAAKAFEAGKFSLLFFNGDGFRPDPTLEERMMWHAPGVQELCGPATIRQKSETVLRELGEEIGREISEAEALDMARGWGQNALTRNNWSIEVIPAVGDAGEDVGYSVVGLMHDDGSQSAMVFDLAEPFAIEYVARTEAARHRLALELLSRIPYALVHRDGVKCYFERERINSGIDDTWPAFRLESNDLQLFLAWGTSLMRGSTVLDGSMTRAAMREYCNESRSGDDFDEAYLREMEQTIGCEDIEG